MCNLAGVELKVINVHLPKTGDDFKTQLESRLTGLPYLEIEEEKYRSSRQIWDHLLSTIKDKNILQRLIRTDSAYSFITQQWANDTFINSLVYARWKKEDNFKRFITGVDFGPHADAESINNLRKLILKYLNRTSVGDLSTDSYQKLITQQFSSLASVIEGQSYFEAFAKHPTFTDLNVFMVVQGFMSRDLEESTWIESTYPALFNWYRNMEIFTQKNPPEDLLG